MNEKFVLVIDDEPDIRQLLQEILDDEGYQVAAAADAAAARQAVREQQPDLVLLDIWMPDEDGISLLKSWKAAGELRFPVIMISGHGTIETAVEATRVGAVDFIEKPVSLAKLLLTVEKAFQAPQPDTGLTTPAPPEPPFLAGVSESTLRLDEQLGNLAANASSLLLVGPEGSGREHYARELHQRASSAAAVVGPAGLFVRLRCESLSPSSYQRELFGSEVNGVISRGYLESAHNGTLFLDNIEQLPLATMASLLSCIEQKNFARVGGTGTQALNARLISSSKYSLQELHAREGFNVDLARQLAGRQLQFCALKDRLEDIPALLEHLVQWHIDAEGLNYRHFTVAAQNLLRNQEWPGNLPELKNLVQRAMILGGNTEIDVQEIETLLGIANATPSEATPSDTTAIVTAALNAEGSNAALAGAVNSVGPGNTEAIALRHDLPLREARAQFERQYLLRCLQNSRGNIGELAKHVGMERTHLYRKLRSLDIDLEKVRE